MKLAKTNIYGSGLFIKTALVFVLLIAVSPFASAQTAPVIFSVSPDAVMGLSPGAVFIVREGSLSNAGYFANASTLHVEGDVINYDTLAGIGNAVFRIKGNWTNNGIFIPAQSTVHLYDSAQVINGSEVTAFSKLVLSGNGVKSLAVDAEVLDSLALNDQELHTAQHTLLVTSVRPDAISRTTGFVSSAPGGKLSRAMNDTVGYIFPLGSSAGPMRFRPVMIKPADTLYQVFGARLANINADVENYSLANRQPDICSINTLYFHHITRDSGMGAADITFFYDINLDGSWTQIAHWQGSPRWEKTLIALANQDSLTGLNTLTIPDWDDFSYTPFALMLPGPALDSSRTAITDASCYGSADGSICVGFPPLTGTPPFHYQWSGTGSSAPCINGLTAGSYTLSITDFFACPSVYHFRVSQPNPIEITPEVQDASCKGALDGQICVSVTGDCPPFSYAWSLPGTGTCLLGLSAGNYGLTVTDSCGCSRSMVIPVGEPNLLVASAVGINASCYRADNGRVSASATGGTPPYSFRWDTPAADTTQVVSNLPPGTYQVLITDSNGCEAIAQIALTQPDPLIVTAGNNDTIYRGFAADIGVADVRGGTPPYQYQWSPSGSVEDPFNPVTTANPESSTVYTIQVTDMQGCTASDTLLVQVDVELYRFPDAFLPEGAQANNRRFRPVTSVTVGQVDLKIFNRWGVMLFDGTIDPSDPMQGWDGTYKGEPQPMDTYVYQAVLHLPGGTRKTESGGFILIR
ncbi:MAG: hypothetical protein KatS3mg031_1558 [Chitinophagales bacterium]|nr:MAG: hypothetical protein KatS3mg031_1558 [Chitinophagales bacterium]